MAGGLFPDITWNRIFLLPNVPEAASFFCCCFLFFSYAPLPWAFSVVHCCLTSHL